jgi:uncharacterized Zn finger protein
LSGHQNDGVTDWSDAQLWEAAGSAVFDRGVAYAADGHVRDLAMDGAVITATVLGSDASYDVRIDDRSVACDCPYAANGDICKHVVAVAISARGDAPPSPDAVASYVDSLSPEDLRELVQRAAERDDILRRELQLAAAAAAEDVGAVRDLVDRTLSTRRYLDYWAAMRWAEEAQPTVDTLRSLAESPSTSSEVIPLIERAVKKAIIVLGRADDSSGLPGGVVDQLLKAHAVAARLGRPDARKLARWLVRFSCDDQDWFNPDVVDYVDALGTAGLEVYRSELQRRLAANPDHYGATHALERLAVATQDAKAVVSLLGGDLSSMYQYLRVAEAMVEMGRDQDALEWARRGLKSGGGAWMHERKLREIAATLLDRRGDTDGAMDVLREGLARGPALDAFGMLRSVASRHGRWEAEREAALVAVRARSHEDFVDALLSEGDPEMAWVAAQAGGARHSTWQRLAKHHAAGHELQVMEVCRDTVRELLQRADRRNYEESVPWLRRMRDSAAACGRRPEFGEFLAELRDLHRNRPTFIKILDAAHL